MGFADMSHLSKETNLRELAGAVDLRFQRLASQVQRFHVNSKPKQLGSVSEHTTQDIFKAEGVFCECNRLQLG